MFQIITINYLYFCISESFIEKTEISENGLGEMNISFTSG